MSDAAALRIRLGAIGAALRSVVGTDQHEAMSRVQANAVVAMLNRGRATISPDDKAALAIMANNVDWYAGHDMPILALLAREAASGNNRSAQQKYTTFVEFLTEDNWRKLLPADGEVPPSNASLNTIIQRVVRLGGYNACEYTTKLMTSLWLLLCEPSVDKMSYFQLKAQHGYVKKEYKRIADKSQKPTTYMPRLPPLPDDLARSHPQFYAMAYTSRAGDGPMRCPLDMGKLREIDGRYRCRGVGPDSQSVGARPQGSGDAASSQLVTFGSSGQDDIRQMIAQQAQQMQQMQTMATHAMSLVAGGRVGAGAGTAGDEWPSLLDNLELFDNAARGRHRKQPAPGRRARAMRQAADW